MVGIIQEQHPERTRLFMQWKQMDWPILVDPLNLLQVTKVPVTLLLDEYGIVRHVRPRPEELPSFLQRTHPRPDHETRSASAAPDLPALRGSEPADDPATWRRRGDALTLWGQPQDLTLAIQAYQRVLHLEPDNGLVHFRLGVAYRKRYDSPERQAGDFQEAVAHWTRALQIDPNQYIWRRRIQQYGPRLDKPYSFYDWVRRARREIAARGETPRALSVEPGGAEFAYPSEAFQTGSATLQEPDPEARILSDREQLIQVESTVVPAQVAAGSAARIHLTFRPNLQRKAHWNNEVDQLLVWVEPPPGWQVDQQRWTVPNPPQAVSQETRHIEFEVSVPEDAAGAAALSGYALYYVCEDVDGTCLYRRQSVSATVPVRPR